MLNEKTRFRTEYIETPCFFYLRNREEIDTNERERICSYKLFKKIKEDNLGDLKL